MPGETSKSAANAPQRIVCLSAESADWLWRLGAWDRVVGLTAFFELPAGAEPTPRVSGFSSAKTSEIIRLQPDLVLASWCGKPVDVDAIGARAGWESMTAVQGRLIREIPGAYILQPGFRLMAGYDRLKRLIAEVP